MRMAAAVLHANKQHGFISHLARAGVEGRVGRVRPMLSRQNWVGRMPMEKFYVKIGSDRISQHSDFLLHGSRDEFYGPERIHPRWTWASSALSATNCVS